MCSLNTSEKKYDTLYWFKINLYISAIFPIVLIVLDIGLCGIKISMSQLLQELFLGVFTVSCTVKNFSVQEEKTSFDEEELSLEMISEVCILFASLAYVCLHIIGSISMIKFIFWAVVCCGLIIGLIKHSLSVNSQRIKKIEENKKEKKERCRSFFDVYMKQVCNLELNSETDELYCEMTSHNYQKTINSFNKNQGWI